MAKDIFVSFVVPDMFEVFRQYILPQCILTEQELEMLRVSSDIRNVRKKQLLQQEGEVSRSMNFIARGCMRMYRMDEQGNEHILYFGAENWWMTDKESYLTGKPSNYFIEAIDNCQLLVWQREDFTRLLQQIPALHTFLNRLVAHSNISMQTRLYESISYTAEEKYQNFLKTHPDIFNRVPLRMIASYLGLSRETLSRVRNQFAHK
jgi:CRP-like cAMP-binding protein